MHSITHSLGMPTIFLRYNPDDFKINGKKQDVDEEERLEYLKERLKYHLENRPDEMLTIEYLYYDSKTNN